MPLRLDVATGGTTLDALDARLPGVVPYVLSRRYESARREAGVLGPGWGFGWEVRLRVGGEVAVEGGVFDGLRFAPVAEGREARQEASGIVLQHHPDVYVLAASPRRRFLFSKAQAAGGALPLVAVQDASGQGLRLDHSGRRLTALTDPDGRRWRLAYEGDRLAAIALEAGARSAPLRTFAYTARGELAAVTDGAGRTARYAYDGGLLVEAVHRTGGRQWAQYDEGRRCIAVWDDAGRVVHAAHDPLRQLVRVVEAGGGQTLFQHIIGRQVVERAAPAGHVQTYYYDEMERLIGYAAADGRTAELHRHDPEARTLLVLHQETRFGSLTLGEHNHTVACTDTSDHVYALALDASGRATTITTPQGHAWQLTRDRSGRVTEVSSPAGRRVRVRWGRGDRAVEDAAGVVWRDALDALGRLTQRTDRLGRTRQLRYDAEGLLAGVTTAGGYTLEVVHDEEGRLISTTDSDRHRLQLRRDPYGRVEGVDLDGLRLRALYDDVGRLRRLGDGGSAVEFEYDPLDRLAAVRSARHGPLAYTYAEGETRVQGPGGSRTYSAAGDPLRREESAASEVFTYGPAGELLVLERESPEGRASALFSYDPDGLPERVVWEAPEGGTAAAFVFDPDGLPLAVETEAVRVAFERDAQGALRAVRVGEAEAVLTLDAGGRLVSLAVGPNRVEIRYDDLDRPVYVTGSGATTEAIDLRAPSAQPWRRAWELGGVTLAIYVARRGVVLAAWHVGLWLPVWWLGEARAEALDPARALAVAVARGPLAVLRAPARGGEAAVRFWTGDEGWAFDHTAVPTSAALGQRWPALSGFFLRDTYGEAFPERVPGALPAHCTDYDRSPHEALTGPHLTGALRPPPWGDRAVGPLLAGEDLLPVRGQVDPVAAAAFLGGA